MKKLISAFLALLTVFSILPFAAVSTDGAFVGEDKINIVLDPGHGGANVGSSARGVGEKVYAMQLATLIREELLANGNFNVYLTRTGDYDLELYQRAEVANNYNADILISIHFDGSQSSAENGTTAYTSVFDTFAAVSLSQSITANVAAAVGLKNNGVRRRYDNAGYYWNFEKQWDCQDPSLGTLSDYYGIPTWCGKFGIKSIIVEHGFFSNAGDVNKVLAEGALAKIAKAEAKAIIDYYTNHIHAYSAPTRDFPSNCMYTGKQSERCSVCGHRRNVSLLTPAPDNHYWVDLGTTPASCGVDGKKVRECRITQNLADKGWEGTVHTETVIIPAPTQHTYELYDQVSATHTVDGYKQWKCKTCSHSFKDILKAEGHTFGEGVYKTPTCTESGGYTYSCTGCSHQYTEAESAKGHSFTVTERLEPTCTEAGYEKRKCTVCGFEETESFEALGHTYPDSATTPPTCTEDGYLKGYCTRCGAEADEIIEKTGHSYTVVENVPATCKAAGKTVSQCSVCQNKEEKAIPVLPHTYESTVTKAATCMEKGTMTYTCTACAHSYEEEITAEGHKRSEYPVKVTNASLLKAGSREFSCENGCGTTFSEAIPPRLDREEKIFILAAALLLIAAAIAAVVIILIRRSRPEDLEPEEVEAAVATIFGDLEENTSDSPDDNVPVVADTPKEEEAAAPAEEAAE